MTAIENIANRTAAGIALAYGSGEATHGEDEGLLSAALEIERVIGGHP